MYRHCGCQLKHTMFQMCSAQAENRLELSDSIASPRSDPISMRKHQPLRAPVQACPECSEGLGSGCACPDWVDARDLLQRHSVTLPSAYYPDRLVPTLAKEGRKAGRKEGRMTCVCKSFPIYVNLFWYPSAHAHPVLPSTHAIQIHVRSVLESWQKKVYCNGCLYLPTFDTGAMAFFSAQ